MAWVGGWVLESESGGVLPSDEGWVAFGYWGMGVGVCCPLTAAAQKLAVLLSPLAA